MLEEHEHCLAEWTKDMFFFFCRVIDAFIEADRKGYKIHVSNDREYVTINIPYPVIKLRI